MTLLGSVKNQIHRNFIHRKMISFDNFFECPSWFLLRGLKTWQKALRIMNTGWVYLIFFLWWEY